MVQVMPGKTPEEGEESISTLQENLDRMGSLSLMIEQGACPEDLIAKAFRGIEKISYLESIKVEFHCKCSRERAERTLSTMGKKDLIALSLEQDITEVRCHFCNEKYLFKKDDLIKLAEKLDKE